jgi:hypothetical protein
MYYILPEVRTAATLVLVSERLEYQCGRGTRSSCLQGYVRTRQHKLHNVFHILGIVVWWIREMQVNVIQTLHYHGYNVKVNKQHGSVLKRCRNVLVPISWEPVTLDSAGLLILPFIILGETSKVYAVMGFTL